MRKQDLDKALTDKAAREAIATGVELFRIACENGSLPGRHSYDAALIIFGALDKAGFRILRKR